MEIYFLLSILVCASAEHKKGLPKYTGVDPKENTGYDELCNTKLCVPKCCPHGYYLFGLNRRCIPLRKKMDFGAAVPVYTKQLTYSDVLKNYNATVIPNKLSDKAFNATSFDIEFMQIPPNYYLTEEGILHVEVPNTYDRWSTYNSSEYCADFTVPMPKFNIRNFTLRYITKHSVKKAVDNPINKYGLMVSVFFLALLLVVYALLQELRNLSGKVLMAYVSSLMGAFQLLFVIKVGTNLSPDVCKGLTFCIYFLFMASFCWMNIMSCDIWWTFRGYAKARPIHRRGENFKFGMYCIYAWGLPVALTVNLIVLNEMNLRQWPWIIKPNVLLHSRFIDGTELLIYLYTPMLILIVCNWVFFLMTAFNIWRLHRATAVLDSTTAGTPAAHRNQKYRFLIYLKLSVIMGINWLMEVLGYFSPEFQGWFIADIYNILVGLSIFLIFVCKKQILQKLKKRLGECNYWKKSRPWNSRSRTSNTTESDVSTTDTLVCNNPKGPVYSLTLIEKQ